MCSECVPSQTHHILTGANIFTSNFFTSKLNAQPEERRYFPKAVKSPCAALVSEDQLSDIQREAHCHCTRKDMAPSTEAVGRISHLPKADGSATFLHGGFAIEASV